MCMWARVTNQHEMEPNTRHGVAYLLPKGSSSGNLSILLRYMMITIIFQGLFCLLKRFNSSFQKFTLSL